MSTLIGLIDKKITEVPPISWEINRIGGFPTYLGRHEKSSKSQTCPLCGQAQVLVSQLYCPLGGSPYHRCLYVYACPVPVCNSQQSGWRVLRCMLYDPAFDTTQPKSNDGKSDVWVDDADDWGIEDADDWGDGSISGGDQDEHIQMMVEQTAADDGHHVADEGTDEQAAAVGLAQMSLTDDNPETGLKVTSSPETGVTSLTHPDVASSTGDTVILDDSMLSDPDRWTAMANILNTKHQQEGECLASAKASTKSPAVLEPYYVEVVEEPPDENEVSPHVLSLIKNYEKSEGCSVSVMEHSNSRPKSGKESDRAHEGYEKTELKHGDKIFHKFLKRLQRCPQQCIRYERGGQPLLMKNFEGGSPAVENCRSCGGARVFELQLLPSLIPWLKIVTDTSQPLEFDFGTVLVYTCANNCWSDDTDMLEEEVKVQQDPDSHLYR